MQIGIIGRPKSGKTTLFNALTGSRLNTSAFAPTTMEPNIGMAKVPDQRQDGLVAVIRPAKVTLAEIRYMDVAIPKGKAKELGGELLVHLSKADAFLHVVRAFADESIPHPEGSVDPGRDIEDMNLELAFIDMGIIERRLNRISALLRGARAVERESLVRQQTLLGRIQDSLGTDVPVRKQSFTAEEKKLVDGYQFLTARPVLVVLNIGEDQVDQTETMQSTFDARYPRLPVTALCARLEMELGQLNQFDAQEFRSSLGAGEPAAGSIIRLSFDLLGLITFFTVGPTEVRAWTITAGTTAVKAAGKVHSDMERGFIRAEVIFYTDLIRCGGFTEAKKQGLLRLEGKNYVVQDGDVITFLFNV